MRGGDKTDIVAAAILKLEHHLGQTLVGYFIFLLLFPRLRDLIILAVNTAEITVAEKDIARAIGSRQARLLAKMSRVARHDRQPAGVARRNLRFLIPVLVGRERPKTGNDFLSGLARAGIRKRLGSNTARSGSRLHRMAIYGL